jgi:hypothetical protein
MASIIRIKRRLEGEAGPPPIIDTGELAYNEADDTLYIGVSYDTSLTDNTSVSSASGSI